jgi:hypothetical protein
MAEQRPYTLKVKVKVERRSGDNCTLLVVSTGGCLFQTVVFGQVLFDALYSHAG